MIRHALPEFKIIDPTPGHGADANDLVEAVASLLFDIIEREDAEAAKVAAMKGVDS